MNAKASCAKSMCSYECKPGWVDLADGGKIIDGGTTCDCHSTATATDPDVPNLTFTDTNCDGINGTIADAIFVDAVGGSDSNPGTIKMPVQTIGKGLTLASASSPLKDVYVSMGTYTESVTLVAGLGIYGGYDAASNWSRAITNVTTIQSPTSTAVLGSTLDAPVKLQLLTIVSSDALSSSESSYGVLIDSSTAGVTVTLEACNVTAGNGNSGTAGASGGTGAAGGTGVTGDSSGTEASGGSSSCSNTGGAGGASVSGSTDGLPGKNGKGPSPGAGGSGGMSPGSCGGSGAGSTPSNDTIGGAGTNGANGTASGVVGTFSGGLFVPGNGGDGKAGTDGSGGGGGGSGAGDSDVCCCIPPCCDQTSGGGGGGGGGGCKGATGKGGTGGGGSFAVAAIKSAMDIEGCALSTASGGDGGPGGNGGNGGNGGFGGPGGGHSGDAGDGAQGAQGGAGGASGAGAGGNGGPSICIAYSSGTVPTQNMNSCTPGSASSGGSGGFNSMLGTAPSGGKGPTGSVLAL
jgi:hypothetical protein